jgi:hypothetical protein
VARHILAGQLPLLRAHRAGEEAEHVDRRRQIVIERLMQRFTAVEGFQLRQLRRLPLDGVGDAQQQSGALGRRGARPVAERLLRGFHRAADLRRRGFGQGDQRLAVGRIDDALLLAFAVDKLTVNELLTGQT